MLRYVVPPFQAHQHNHEPVCEATCVSVCDFFCERARASVQVEAFKEQVDEAINKAQKMMDRGELR